MRRLLAIIILACGAAISIVAADTDSKYDSLKALLPTLKGEALLKLYPEIYGATLEGDDELLPLYYLNEYLKEAHRQHNLKEECDARMMIVGHCYNYDLNDSLYAHAHEYLDFMRTHEKWETYYEIWTNLVNGYTFNGLSNTALKEAKDMFKDAMDRGNKLGQGMAYYVMGNVYNNMNNTDEAISAYKQSIAITSQLDTLPLSAPDVYSYLGDVYEAQHKYKELSELLVPWKALLDRFDETGNGRMVNWCYYYLASVQADLGLNKLEEAETTLEKIYDNLKGDAEFLYLSWLYYKAQLRLQQERYDEALQLNNKRMQLMMNSDDKSVLIQVRKQRAEILTHLGRFEEAAEMYREMYVINDSINTHDTRRQLTEMNTLFHVDELKMEQARAQMRNLIIIASIIVLSLVVFIYFRIRAAKRLKAAHQKLEQTHSELEKTHSDLLTAYDQLEETTAAKERIESDLRIARDIQMSMVPATFPDRPDVDIFASMTPAKEVGGDLYGYLLQEEEEKLYFALGDVSGKGVPASLFMAQATRLFRTLAAQQMMPAEICTRINDALSGEDNERGMFVTMFMGLVDLKTGHLHFCNAGHNPPVLVEEGKAEFIEMIPNAPIGLWPGLEYEGEEIESIMDKPLFVYSDGLNEAENRQQEQFTDERLLDILANTPFVSSKQTIEMLSAEVEKHRDGAEPNDDLTMLCVKVRKQTEIQ